MELLTAKKGGPSCEQLVTADKAQHEVKPLLTADWMNMIVESLDKNNGIEKEVEFVDGEGLEKKVEKILTARVTGGDSGAAFLLGQLCYEQARYDEAVHHFEEAIKLKGNNYQALYQLGVMYYEGIGCVENHKHGFELMHQVALCQSAQAKHVVHNAQYNVAVAYYNGVGVKRCNDEAEKFWLLAADNGNPKASVRAQSTLGMFYSTGGSTDLEKAFYWHTEACGNGSLESQGALGVMYMNGLGTEKNEDSAFICWREAAKRGNIYAIGHLIAYYYKNKLFTKALGLSARLSVIDPHSVEEISEDTDCTVAYINKGIAMGCYYYGLCLKNGRGIVQDEEEAVNYFSRSFQFDEDTCASLHRDNQRGLL